MDTALWQQRKEYVTIMTKGKTSNSLSVVGRGFNNVSGHVYVARHCQSLASQTSSILQQLLLAALIQSELGLTSLNTVNQFHIYQFVTDERAVGNAIYI